MYVAEPSEGLVIAGKYRLLERIGAGGMGEVYRAENTAIGRTVAVKLLKRSEATDRDMAQRLLTEAKTIGALHHPAIVDVYDAGVGETGPYVVMEYLTGASAAKVIARFGRFGLDASVVTALAIVDALTATHDRGIVHRDLKPENVFFAFSEPEGARIKLLDFGIAKVLAPLDGTPQTATGVIFGTPDYMSPEQASGDGPITERTDLFSFGVLFYELLTGQRPFSGPTAVATAYRIAHARTPTLSEHGGPDHAVLDAIISRALAKRPSERYGSARELATELRTVAIDRELGVKELDHLVRTMVGSVRPSSPDGHLGTTSGKLLRSPASPWSAPLAPPVSNSPLARAAFLTTERSEGDRPTPNRGLTPRRGATPRPVPAATRAHVRGVVLRAFDRAVRDAVGEAARGDLLASLPHEHSRDFLYGTVQGIVQYELAILVAYVEAATPVVHRGNASGWHGAGAKALTGELAPLFRNALRTEAPLALTRRVVALCERFFDFGRWEVTAEAERIVAVRAWDFEAAPLALRFWLAGLLDEAAQRATPRANARMSRGDTPGAPLLAIDVTW